MNSKDTGQQVMQAGPLALVIFGITGDLSKRMLLPALYDLAVQDLLPEKLCIVGISRRSVKVKDLISQIEKTVQQKGDKCNQRVLAKLARQIELVIMDLAKTEEYKKLRHRLDQIEEEAMVCMNRLFYMAIPAELFKDAVEHMGLGGLQHSCPHGTGESRLLVEKPFGQDYASAKELVGNLRKYFAERQIYRIDHFLAKETAQNILTFRARNPLFRAIWDKSHVSHLLISAVEELDIEGRGSFYEQTGALRDMIQSHVLQLLALTTMDLPDYFTAKAIHAKKQALLRAVERADEGQAVRGQYQGYRREVSNPSSKIETYVALRPNINNDRWRNVPILLRTGKALAKKMTEITLIISDHDSKLSNALTFQLSPNEGISIHIKAKKPGFEDEMQEVFMDFCYSRSFPGRRQPTAYERVLVDAFRGDKTLFATSTEVLSSWRILELLLKKWSRDGQNLRRYPKGSYGPKEADELIKSAGQDWPTEIIESCLE